MLAECRKPKVSVLMSVYNEDNNHLKIAINSILRQSLRDFEFVIIDDGTTKENQQILHEYQIMDNRVRVITNPQNIGLTKSLNIGLNHCRGEYIARMDSDDESLPDRFLNQVELMDSLDDVIVVGGLAKVMGKSQTIVPYIDDFQRMKIRLLFYNAALAHPTALINRSLLEKYSISYDEKLERAQDYMLWADCIKYGEIRVLPEIVLNYRVHDKQISNKYVDGQLISSMRVQQKLFHLYFEEELTDKEAKAHSLIIRGIISSSIGNIKKHFKKMVKLNEKSGCFDHKLFKQELMIIWAIFVIRAIRNRGDFRGLFSLYTIRAFMSISTWKNILALVRNH